MKIPFLAWLLNGIPESIGIAAVAISLGHGRLNWRPILTIGYIQAVLAYMIRLLPITYGVHTIILIMTLAVFLVFIGKIEIRKAIIYSNAGMLIVCICEIIFMSLIINLGIFTLDDIRNDVLVRIITGTPHVIIIFLVAFSISRYYLLKEQNTAKICAVKKG